MRKVSEIEAVGKELADYQFPTEEIKDLAKAKELWAAGYLLTACDAEGEPIAFSDAKDNPKARLVWHKAVSKTSGAETKKGYNTTGYGYQFVVNALNEILHLDGWATEAGYTMIEGAYTNGRPSYTAICELKLIVFLSREPDSPVQIARASHGGHLSSERDSAFKGAYTNALKKVAALYGLGRLAYEGTLDEDYRKLEGEPAAQPAAATTRPAAVPAASTTSKAGAKKAAPATPAEALGAQPAGEKKPDTLDAFFNAFAPLCASFAKALPSWTRAVPHMLRQTYEIEDMRVATPNRDTALRALYNGFKVLKPAIRKQMIEQALDEIRTASTPAAAPTDVPPDDLPFGPETDEVIL